VKTTYKRHRIYAASLKTITKSISPLSIHTPPTNPSCLPERPAAQLREKRKNSSQKNTENTNREVPEKTEQMLSQKRENSSVKHRSRPKTPQLS